MPIRAFRSSSLIDLDDETLSLVVSDALVCNIGLTQSTKLGWGIEAKDRQGEGQLYRQLVAREYARASLLVKKNSATTVPEAVWTISYGFNRP